MFFLDGNAEIHIQGQSILPKIAHNLTQHAAAAATCTESGCDSYYSCSVCKGLYRDSAAKTEISEPPYVTKLGHTLSAIPAKSPSCTEEGYNEYFKCGRCNKLFSDNTATTEIHEPIVIEKSTHCLVKNVEVVPSCQKSGCDEYFTCINCGAYYADEAASHKIDSPPILEQLPHALTEYPESLPTCTQEGRSAYYVCNNCDTLFLDRDATLPASAPNVLAVLPHTPYKIDEIPSSCTVAGTEGYYKCEVCKGIFSSVECTEQKSEINALPLAAHETVLIPKTDSTCTVKGSAEYYKCSECNELFTNSDATEKFSGDFELPLVPHIFEGNECKSCGQKILLTEYLDFILADENSSVAVCGYVTAISKTTNTVYVQYGDYAYRLLNCNTNNIKVDDVIIAMGIKADNATVDCSYVSHYELKNDEDLPTLQNVTELLQNDMQAILPIKQYTYVEINNLTVLYSSGNKYVMAYMNADDLSDGATERYVYFTLDTNTPISERDIQLIDSNFVPMYNVTARGLIYQDGNSIHLIPISDNFLTDIAEPVEVPPDVMLRYESLVYQFEYSVISEDCVINLNCTPLYYEDVRLKWYSLSDSVVIGNACDDGYCTATVTVNGSERVSLILEFSIDYGSHSPLIYKIHYHLNLT